MPQDKSFLFAKRKQQTSAVAKALSHPARLRIVDLIREQNFIIHKDLTDAIPLGGATISQHLDSLMRVHILKKDEFFGVVGYTLNTKGWLTASTYLQDFLNGYQGQSEEDKETL